MPIEAKLDYEWLTLKKKSPEDDPPKAVLKGTDHDNAVEIKLELKFSDGNIPTAYQKVIGNPGDEIRMILGNKSMQMSLEEQE